jgi:hypothetical protein
MDLATAVAEKSHLSEALSIIFGAKASGILRVISSSVNGRLAIDNGEILGAINTYTGNTGDGALHEFMESGVAVFQFIETDVPSDLRQSLSVDTGSYVYELERAKEESLFLQEEESKVFQESDPNFDKSGPTKSSLNEEQQKLLGLYARLNNEADRRAFLQSNNEFSDMMDGKGLNEQQRTELTRATYGGDQASMQAFIDFQQELLGPSNAALTAQQRQMLQDVYAQLSDQDAREAFLKENTAMTDDRPVTRGGGVTHPRDQVKSVPKYDEFIPELSNLGPESSSARPAKRLSLEEMEAIEREEMSRSGAHYFSVEEKSNQKVAAADDDKGKSISLPVMIAGALCLILLIAAIAAVVLAPH